MTVITAITAAELITGEERIASPVVLIEEGRIVAMGEREAVAIPAGARVRNFSEAVLAPGFVDLHIHGSAGYDVMEGSKAGLASMARYLGSRGVAAFLATTVTAEPEILCSAVARLAEQIQEWNTESAAQPVGIHLEGPCISRARAGVHPLEAIQNPSRELFEQLYEAAGGTLRLMTVAPELPGAMELIALARARGVRIALGHTDASAMVAREAIAAGATHVTHTFNAMRPLEHRSPGLIAEALGNDALTAEIIADGIHVDPAVVRLFLKAKGAQRAVLVTDAISATGMGDGQYKLGGLDVTVAGERAECSGKLAGSVLTLERAVRNVMRFAGWTLAESVRLATVNPAAVLGDTTRGRLCVGAAADMVILTAQGELVESLLGGVTTRA